MPDGINRNLSIDLERILSIGPAASPEPDRDATGK
jgi:hypothetical protein